MGRAMERFFSLQEERDLFNAQDAGWGAGYHADLWFWEGQTAPVDKEHRENVCVGKMNVTP